MYLWIIKFEGHAGWGEGVDLNRNFPVGWEKRFGVCDSTYGGEEPFSEPETRALRDAFQVCTKSDLKTGKGCVLT